MESLQFPHVLIYLETSPLQKLSGEHYSAIIPGEGTRIVRLGGNFLDISHIFSRDYSNVLSTF